jgi:small-conductance mechanosensitive channel
MWEETLRMMADWAAGTGIRLLLVIVGLLSLLLIVRISKKRVLSALDKKDASAGRIKRIKTLSMILHKVIVILIWVLGILTILSELEVDLAPVLTVVGIAGLAFSFGAQALVKDIISGMFILIEDQVRIGDVVKIGDHAGVVEDISLRTIRLRALDGELHIIPNGNVTAIVNMTKDFSRKTFDIPVAYREDVDRVIQIVREVGDALAADPVFGKVVKGPFEVWGLERFEDSAMIIRARITTKPVKQWEIGREFNRRLKKRFDQEGIEIPFPQRVVHHRNHGGR